MPAPRRASRSPRHAATLCGRLASALLLTLLLLALSPSRALAAPQIWLPTPPGEPWRIIQGYGCGTHHGYDRFSLDIAADRGETRGAPVSAAAAGTVWAIEGGSGSVILDHGDGFRTLYTHMQR